MFIKQTKYNSINLQALSELEVNIILFALEDAAARCIEPDGIGSYGGKVALDIYKEIKKGMIQ